MTELSDILERRDRRLATALDRRQRLADGLREKTRWARRAPGSPLVLAGAFAGGWLTRRLHERKRGADDTDQLGDTDVDAIADAVVARLHEEPPPAEQNAHPWLGVAGQMAFTIMSRMIAQRLLAAWQAPAGAGESTAAPDPSADLPPDG